jgi:putative transposase
VTLPIDIVGIRDIIATSHIAKAMPVNALCKVFHTTRKTVCKWSNRLKREGKEGLKNKSRAPKTVHNKKSREIEDEVCDRFKDGHTIEEIYLALRDKLCEKTVYNILHRRGMLKKDKIKRKFHCYEYEKPNDLWHMDFTEFRVKGYKTQYIVAITDDHSRYLVCFGIFEQKSSINCLSVLISAVKRHGLPKALLTDNGKQFISALFDGYLDSMAIKHRRTRPYNPRCNGKIERWFRSLKDKLKRKIYKNPGELAKEVSLFVGSYNYRPKRVLNWQTPKQRYL